MGNTVAQQADPSQNFLRVARAGNLAKVLDYLNCGTRIDTCNTNGLNALHLAAKEGHTAVVRELLMRNADPDACTKKGNTALHIACLAGQLEVARLLIEKGAKVNCQSQNGFTPLYMAAQENHVDVVRLLLASGALQTLATTDGFTPLAVALQQGHDRVVAILLENDTRGRSRMPALHVAAKKDDTRSAALLLTAECDTNQQAGSGFTALHIAAHYGSSGVAGLLLERGADATYPARNGIAPLHVAAKWGTQAVAQRLLDAGASVDCRTRDGLTPLHCAARSGQTAVLELLLARQAGVSVRSRSGLTPLHMAVQGDHADCARLLLSHGAHSEDATVDLLTPLHVAAHCGFAGSAQLLLDHGCRVAPRALNGFTPLHIACKKNRLRVVELLLARGADPAAATESGLTPLHVAAYMGHAAVVSRLLVPPPLDQRSSTGSAGGDSTAAAAAAAVSATTIRGETPLHLAVRGGHAEVVRLLLGRGGCPVDAVARDCQTALHVACRMGNAEAVAVLLQAGADPNATSKDAYTPLHAAAKEGHETVVRLLLDAGADPHAATRRGATPLHTAAKYDRAGVIRQLLLTTTSRSGPASAVKADANARGRNGLTPLHLAAHYHRLSAAQALLEAGASALCAASNGYTPVHIAARRGAVDLAACLLDAAASGAAVAASKSGFAPLHLAAQEGHAELCDLLVNRGARVDQASTGGVAPLHLAAQEDRLAVAESLVVHHGAQVDPTTRAGFTPLHAACFFGRLSTARFLLGHGAAASARDNAGGATPLHLAAQEGHLQLVLALLAAGVEPSPLNSRGHTPAQLARCRGHREVFEALRSSGGGSSQVRTWEEEELTTIEETVEMCRPDTLAEQNMSDSEEEAAEPFEVTSMPPSPIFSSPPSVRESGGAGKISNLGKQRGESKSLDETTGDIERMGTLSAQKDAAVLDMVEPSSYASQYKEPEQLSPLTLTGSSKAAAAAAVTAGKDNTPTERLPVVSGFLVSFLVDARGGAMTGARCPGLRIVVPPNAATGPTRVTCRLLRPGRVSRPPQLNDGEGLACRILEFGCSCRSFASPVLLEVPHMAALRNSEREIVVYRSDTGETWKEHALEASEQAVLDVIGGFFGSPLESNEELRQRRIVRILTASLPQYFALVTRLRQEAALIGPEGGVIGASLANGRVQSVFPDGALTKKIRVGVQVFPIPSEAAARLFGGAGQRRIAASPVVTIEPRRRKFHKPITLTLPLPSAASASGLGASQTLRLLCSITGGAQPATWEDITGSTALSHVKDSVSFTTTVSARFWLVDCQNPAEAAEMAGKLYREAAAVPYMGRFVVYAKRTHPDEARLRCLCITDDRADKTLETAQGFERKAESREVEILDGRPLWIEGLDNLTAFHVAAEPRGLFDHQQQHQLQQPPFFTVRAFRENRLTCGARPRDADQPAAGRVAFLAEPQTTSATTAAICTLELALPDYSGPPISKAARPAPRAASDVAAPAESADEPELVAAVDPTHGVARSYTADEEAAARRAKTEAYLELVRTLEEQTPEPKPLATTSEFEDKESVDEAVVEPSKAPGSPEKRAKEGLNAVEELLARLDARPDQSMAPEAGTPEEVVDVPKSISQVQAQVHTPPETAAGVPIEEKLEKRDAIQDQSMAPEAVTPEEVVEVPKTVTQAQALPKATADVEETLHKLDVHQDQSMAPEAGTPEEVVEVPKIVGIAHAEQRRSSSVADEAAAEEPDDAADAEDNSRSQRSAASEAREDSGTWATPDSQRPRLRRRRERTDSSADRSTTASSAVSADFTDITTGASEDTLLGADDPSSSDEAWREALMEAASASASGTATVTSSSTPDELSRPRATDSDEHGDNSSASLVMRLEQRTRYYVNPRRPEQRLVIDKQRLVSVWQEGAQPPAVIQTDMDKQAAEFMAESHDKPDQRFD
ncbi:hypothetical protein BOX15_Mlig030409g1 [Macrostomum lignano]|uniref:ZU5 domain-containing protein n=1 Tax=Macrostomum lignano TaxID=282301 RepID=A0A267GBI5_9PLAT|nr:hypothetical protein BOX15_Mlig030409g1 [Macrostomum lignano]